MPKTAISNKDIRSTVEEEIATTLREFFGLREIDDDVIDEILSIKNLAVVDRDAELPENFYDTGEYSIAFRNGQGSMLNEGWVKECL